MPYYCHFLKTRIFMPPHLEFIFLIKIDLGCNLGLSFS